MIDEHDKQLIVALAKEGLTARVIANKFEITPHTVAIICNQFGESVRATERKQRGDEALMMELIKQGKNATYIADVARVCASRVRKIQADLGLDYRANLKKFEKKARQVFMLWCDGMTVQDACNVVGISVASYNRQKLKLKLGKKAH